MEQAKKRLITSALPYVNNIPHLGNLVQMLSADVFARFCRLRGYKTLYICGTDEYGTATETKALEEHKSPRELCDYYYNEHKKIYDWFGISFDKFGRTSNDECTQTTQGLFLDLDKAGLINEHTSKQFYCEKCGRFLADRYVKGKCPKCGADTKGDQCDGCGEVFSSVELEEPKCTICASTPVVRETNHLYIDLPKMKDALEKWIDDASVKGKWAENAVKMTKAWLRDGLKERAITRDLEWGIDVPREGYDGKNGSPRKVFYVWFNASIGYISITKQLATELKAAGKESFDWREWWIPSESEGDKGEVQLFQFIGKDNIIFHTILFPSTLMASPHPWTKLFCMSSTEYLNYEDKKFSKSAGIGVFGSDAIESGIKADEWRFYIFYNRPEKQDFQFTWSDFQKKVNSELVGNLANLVNRTLTFVSRYYNGLIPQGKVDEELWAKVREKESEVTQLLEWAREKEAFHKVFEIADICNKAFQAAEPWKARSENPQVAESLIYNLCYVIKDLMTMSAPFIPDYAKTVMSYFGKEVEPWSTLGELSGLQSVQNNAIYFTPMDDKTTALYKARYGGQKNGKKGEQKAASKNQKKKEPRPTLTSQEQIEVFNKKIKLIVALIKKVERNSKSEKLYIETLDDASGCERVIQSGLVPYLSEEELLGKKIILAANLAPRAMCGVTSHGMLLAADYKDENGKDCVELLTAPNAKVGECVTIEGEVGAQKPDEISADEFFDVEIKVIDHKVTIGGKPLSVGGEVLRTTKTVNGSVN